MSLHLRGILGNSAWLGALQGAYYFLPLLTIPVVTRAFGPELFGFVVTATAAAAYVTLIVGFGFGWSGPRTVARTRDNLDELSQDSSAIFGIQLLLAAACSIVFVIWTYYFDFRPDMRLAVWAILATAVLNGLVPAWLFLGLERMRDLVIPQLLTRLTATIAIVLMVRGREDLLLYVLINAVAAAAGLVMFLRLMRGAGVRLQPPLLSRVRVQFRQSITLFVTNAATTAYTTANVLIVSMLLGNSAAGIFGLADRIRQAAVNAFVPLTQAVYPFVCRTVGTDDPSEKLATRRMFQIMWLTAALAGLLLFMAAPLAVELLGGPEFAGAVPLVRVFAVIPLLVVTSNILGVQIMLPLGMDRIVASIVAVLAAIGVLLQIVFIHKFGIFGAAAAYVIVEAAVCACFALALLWRRHLRSQDCVRAAK